MAEGGNRYIAEVVKALVGRCSTPTPFEYVVRFSVNITSLILVSGGIVVVESVIVFVVCVSEGGSLAFASVLGSCYFAQVPPSAVV